MIEIENLTRESEKLIAEIEKSVRFDDKPKTWNFDSVAYVAQLIAHVKDLQSLLDIEVKENERLKNDNGSLVMDLDWYHQRLRKESSDKD